MTIPDHSLHGHCWDAESVLLVTIRGATLRRLPHRSPFWLENVAAKRVMAVEPDLLFPQRGRDACTSTTTSVQQRTKMNRTHHQARLRDRRSQRFRIGLIPQCS